MQGRAFLDLAQELILGGTEAHRRGAVGRAYYGLMLESREALFSWGLNCRPVTMYIPLSGYVLPSPQMLT